MTYRLPVTGLMEKYLDGFAIMRVLLQFQPPVQYQIYFGDKHALLSFSMFDYCQKYYSEIEVKAVDKFIVSFLASIDQKRPKGLFDSWSGKLNQVEEYEKYKDVLKKNPSNYHKIIEKNYNTSSSLMTGADNVPGDTNFNAMGLLAELRSVWGGLASGLNKESIVESYDIQKYGNVGNFCKHLKRNGYPHAIVEDSQLDNSGVELNRYAVFSEEHIFNVFALNFGHGTLRVNLNDWIGPGYSPRKYWISIGLEAPLSAMIPGANKNIKPQNWELEGTIDEGSGFLYKLKFVGFEEHGTYEYDDVRVLVPTGPIHSIIKHFADQDPESVARFNDAIGLERIEVVAIPESNEFGITRIA